MRVAFHCAARDYGRQRTFLKSERVGRVGGLCFFCFACSRFRFACVRLCLGAPWLCRSRSCLVPRLCVCSVLLSLVARFRSLPCALCLLTPTPPHVPRQVPPLSELSATLQNSRIYLVRCGAAVSRTNAVSPILTEVGNVRFAQYCCKQTKPSHLPPTRVTKYLSQNNCLRFVAVLSPFAV